MVTYMGRGVFLRGQPRPIPKGGPQRRQIFGPPTCIHMVRQIAAKFYMVIKLDEQKLFTVSTTLPSLAIFFHTNAEARSICSSLPSCYCLFTSDKLQNRAAQYTLTDVVQSDICFVR